MKIRNAKDSDIPKMLELLSQVLEIHAKIRPDIFISGTTKYTNQNLQEIIRDDQKRIYVAANDADECIGYAFCVIQQPQSSVNMVPHKKLYIDDLCVDASARGQHVGEQLFDYVKQQAKEMDCYEVTLAVWEGNDSARGFYEHLGLKPKETIMEYIVEDKK